MSEKIDTTMSAGLLFAVVAGALAALTYFEAPGLLWIAIILWLFLTFLALLAHSDKSKCAYVVGTLRKKHFTQVYTPITRRILGFFWRRVCDPIDDKASPPAIFRAALTWRLYDGALLVAVVYPIALISIIWLLIGHEGMLGSAIVLEAATFWPERAVVLAGLAVVAVGPILRKRAAASSYRFVRQNADWWIFLPLILAIPIIRGFVGVFPMGFLFGILIVFVMALTVQYIGALAISSFYFIAIIFSFPISPAIALLLTIIAMFIYAILRFEEKERPVIARWFQTIGMFLAWLVVPLLLPWHDNSEIGFGVYVFIGVFPLINALFDVMSYAITLTLMQLGLRSKVPLIWGAVDLLIAMALFLGLGATLTIVIATMNRIAGVPLVDLGMLFAGVYENPSDYVWLYLMLFSTILPTAAHGVLSLLGAQGLTRRSTRRRVANWVKNGGTYATVFAPYAVGAIWALPFLTIGAAAWWVWMFVGGWATSFGWFYFDQLRDLAHWIGAF